MRQKTSPFRRMRELLTNALAQSDELNHFVHKALCELNGLTKQDCKVLLRLINKRKPADESEAGALAVLKHIIKEA